MHLGFLFCVVISLKLQLFDFNVFEFFIQRVIDRFLFLLFIRLVLYSI